jgi:hypothetical protein
VTEGTLKKLHPALVSFLSALKTYREESESDIPYAAFRLFTSLLRTVREKLGIPPTSHKNSFSRIGNHPNFTRQPQQAFVSTRTGTVYELFHEPTATKLLEFADKTHRNTSAEAQVFTGPMWKALKSLRSNRDPQPASQKFSHGIILMFLFLFGALKRTGSDLSVGTLTQEELKEVFDYACPACRENHSSEALRKNASRFVEETLRQWPARKMSGTRSRPRTIEVKHLNLVRHIGA